MTSVRATTATTRPMDGTPGVPDVYGAPRRQEPPPSARTLTVLVYLLLALLALAPGAALKLGWAPEGLTPLAGYLADVRFGSGLRFWLGVTGATLLALLLLYPLRKLLARGRALGSVGAWFHVHMIIGLLAPILILYHANFGRGGSNANVALWTMLIVVLSGILGHFVYASVSANFYSGRARAREELDQLREALASLDALHPSRWHLIDELEAFEAELLTPRLGLIACLEARWRLGERQRYFVRAVSWHLEQCATQLHMSETERQQASAVLGRHLSQFMRIAKRTASRSIREQVLARWRLFHLPVFLVMVAATVLHVRAVWDIDRPQRHTGAVAPVALVPVAAKKLVSATAPEGMAEKRLVDPIAAEIRKSIIPPAPVPAVRPNPATARPQLVEAAPPSAKPEKRAPSPAKRPAEAPRKASEAPSPAEPWPQPETKIDTASGELKAPADMKSVYSELEKRLDAPLSVGPMGLGAPKRRTLAEQIADLKAKRKTGDFSHSLEETGFALTGRHTKADCAACHTVPLQEKKSESPRLCIDCHRQDDIHGGRRPDCASCHTTNRWSQIIRKR